MADILGRDRVRKVYLDAIELAEREVHGVFTDGEQEVILAGPTIYLIEAAFKEDYQIYTELYDIYFIFDDALPAIEFYTIPRIDIFAMDNLGGFIGTIGQSSDIESDAPICYINKELECFIIAESAKAFLENIDSWRENLKFYDKIKFYRSKIEAENELEFIDLPKRRSL